MKVKQKNLVKKYPPSEPCDCQVCLSYCQRPGWWTVAQAGNAFRAGYSGRMMLEVSPEHKFAVLSPAFKGCEGGFALQEFATQGCNFLLPDQHCELFGSIFQPLECRFCHHNRPGLGPLCHAIWRWTGKQRQAFCWSGAGASRLGCGICWMLSA